MLCGEVAATQSDLDDEIRETGLKLMREWNQLQTPAIGTRPDAQMLQTRRSTLRQRMINFLVSI